MMIERKAIELEEMPVDIDFFGKIFINLSINYPKLRGTFSLYLKEIRTEAFLGLLKLDRIWTLLEKRIRKFTIADQTNGVNQELKLKTGMVFNFDFLRIGYQRKLLSRPTKKQMKMMMKKTKKPATTCTKREQFVCVHKILVSLIIFDIFYGPSAVIIFIETRAYSTTVCFSLQDLGFLIDGRIAVNLCLEANIVKSVTLLVTPLLFEAQVEHYGLQLVFIYLLRMFPKWNGQAFSFKLYVNMVFPFELCLNAYIISDFTIMKGLYLLLF